MQQMTPCATVRAEPPVLSFVEGVEACTSLRGCGPSSKPGLAPAGDLLFFASPKKPKEKKGDPMVRVPRAALRGNLRCSPKAGSRSNSPSAQTIASPDPLLAALLGPAQRVGETTNIQIPNPNPESHPESKKRAALLRRDSPATVMFARERSTRGHMRSPSIAQRGEGGARGGSGESDLPKQARRSRSAIPASTHWQQASPTDTP